MTYTESDEARGYRERGDTAAYEKAVIADVSQMLWASMAPHERLMFDAMAMLPATRSIAAEAEATRVLGRPVLPREICVALFGRREA